MKKVKLQAKDKRALHCNYGQLYWVYLSHLSSVGAGAFGIMALVLMFPNLPMIRIIGSDVVHAVLLTLVAGLGHMSSGNVDFHLLAWLLVGSIPAIVVGTLVSSRLPEKIIRKVLGITLFIIGINFMVNPVKSKPVSAETAICAVTDATSKTIVNIPFNLTIRFITYFLKKYSSFYNKMTVKFMLYSELLNNLLYDQTSDGNEYITVKSYYTI